MPLIIRKDKVKALKTAEELSMDNSYSTVISVDMQCDEKQRSAGEVVPYDEKHWSAGEVLQRDEKYRSAGEVVPYDEKRRPAKKVLQCEEKRRPAKKVLQRDEKHWSAGEVLPCDEKRRPAKKVPQCDEKQRSARKVLPFPGPLLRPDMQKDKLMRFIQEKRQECLLHIDEPQQLNAFCFWSIMERFCDSNESVMMSEIAVLLFDSYNLYRKKLGRKKNQEQWCISLAKLLCSAAPEDQLKEEIIKMGKDFASRNWTYPAHICFILAQLELGKYKDFELIGCVSLPEDKLAMMEVLERTEVYEYVLSLSSGFGQPSFQYLKYHYAFALFELGRSAQALQYVETIAAEVIRCPSRHEPKLIRLLRELGLLLLKEVKNGETKWLAKLQQLEESQSKDQPKFHPSKGKVESVYTIQELLGKGGFGSVFAGVRKKDGKQVAIKYVAKDSCEKYITIPGTKRSLPLEVGLMIMVSKPNSDFIVKLLEWFETPKFFILVLERPDQCMDLHRYCRLQGGKLSEDESQLIMEQVVEAAYHCCKRGVFHRDIKPLNILISTSSMDVKLIDFGCGDILTDKVYTSRTGTPIYFPPELIRYQRYHGVPATVWSLGIVLYELVCGTLPFKNSREIVEGKLKYPPHLSKECRMLINWCLQPDPKKRPSFEQILNHEWFMKDFESID